jgi:arylsulfatase A-like enzyme
VPMNPLDIAPTVCGLAGVPRASAFVGRDYSALVPDVGRPG